MAKISRCARIAARECRWWGRLIGAPSSKICKPEVSVEEWLCRSGCMIHRVPRGVVLQETGQALAVKALKRETLKYENGHAVLQILEIARLAPYRGAFGGRPTNPLFPAVVVL